MEAPVQATTGVRPEIRLRYLREKLERVGSGSVFVGGVEREPFEGRRACRSAQPLGKRLRRQLIRRSLQRSPRRPWEREARASWFGFRPRHGRRFRASLWAKGARSRV